MTITAKVLVFNTTGIISHVHADGCAALRRYARSSYRVIRDDVEDSIRDLIDRGYRVVNCKCLAAAAE